MRSQVVAWFIVAIVCIAQAEEIVVPDEAPDIQTALDSIGNGDTILVRIQAYAEILVAPALRFHLIGDYDPDGGDFARPLISATGIGNSDTLAALWLPPSCEITIENFRIENSERDCIRSYARLAELRNCIAADGMFGFRAGSDSSLSFVRVFDCVFQSQTHGCVVLTRGSFLEARRSSFFGIIQPSGTLVLAQNLRIDSCQFSSSPGRPLLAGIGGLLQVSNCMFSDLEMATVSQIVHLETNLLLEVADNVFSNCSYSQRVLDITSDTGDLAHLTGNSFENCQSNPPNFAAQGVVGINIWSAGVRGPLLEENTFISCSGQSSADDIFGPTLFPGMLVDNSFLNDSSNGLPSVYAGNPVWQPTPLTLRNNRFEDCGYAVELSWAADARFNWWGDNSGPYEATENPDGLGDTITGGVQFVPWLTDSTEDADERMELATDIELTAYPNPFNAQTQIEFTLPRKTQVKASVFDLLGREVETLSDEVWGAGRHGITFNGERLASGIYFVRLETPSAAQVRRLMLLK